MQLRGFILHSLLCYYNDGEVVKKNVQLERGKSINSCDEPIRNPYGEEKKETVKADAPPFIADISEELLLLKYCVC
jgi:hypothetical protein